MAFLNRLKWVSAGLAIAGVITTAAVWGDPSRTRPATPVATPPTKLFADDVASRFTQKPAVAYQSSDGGVYFALQVRPDLPAAASRPRDIQILIDHSASQAGAPLEAARRIAKEVVAAAGESDRVAVWAVSTPKATRNLIRGGGLKSAADAKAAFVPMEAEYASGAVDLKNAIDRAAKEFDGKVTRQQVILYLGDGESALNPLDETGRYKLATELRAQNISFYAVPLGTPMNPHNLHALVSGTGGALMRPSDENTSDALAAIKGLATRFHKSMGVSVLEPSKMTFAAEAAEIYPGKLPPLRSDVPTLVVGKFEKDKVPANLELTIEGKVAGTATTAKVTQPMPAATADNYFLGSMVAQWRNSGRADSPALLQADRTLALAFESTRLAREEFLEQATWALGAKRVDTAKALYEAALKLDPEEPRAKAGVKLVAKLEKGDLSFDDLKKGNIEQIAQKEPANLQVPPPAAPKAAPGAKDAPGDANALLRQAEAQQRIREQQVTVAVEETLARVRTLLNAGDPRSSKDLLVAQRDTVRSAGDIGEAVRQRLLNRIELLLQDVVTRGDAMVRARAEENERIARARQRLIAVDQVEAREERIRERIRNFGTLMSQARYEDAYREALVMENEFLSNGYGSPGETFAVSRIGQAASNYRDFRELVRLREDRYLLAMMEVEKSHMPYPDEPAVHFPPAKIWRELTTRRREYSGTDFDQNLNPRQKQRYSMLQAALLQTLDLRELKGGDFAFGALLTDLQRLVSNRMKRDVTIYINYNTFAPEQRTTLRDAKVNLNSLMDATGENLLKEITFKTIMETLTRQVGASFWVTPDYIEVVEVEKAATTRVFKVLAVEDLIVPIPNAVNNLALQQQLQVLGQQFSLAGGNAFGALGAFGGGFGGFVGGNGGGGQGNNFGGGAQNAGQLFQGQGGGGGVLGFGGGNAGQFGNLGGQFGFQGGRQSKDPATELVVLIQTVVDPGYWDPDVSFLSKNLLTGQTGDDPASPDSMVEAALRNKMMYNLTTRSLVIFGRSRFHRSTPGRPLKKDDIAAGERPNPDGRGIAKNEPKAPAVGGPAAVATAAKPKTPVDAERMWMQAIERGVREPGMVIACAEYLVQAREFKHAAELLKASLRSGLTPERWYQEALAIALEESQGSPEEIERAHLSAIDLEPKNPQTYLQVAKSLHDMGDEDGAVRMCKVAAKLEPNMPDAYTSALVYADGPKATASYDVTAFAAGGLLSRDWPMDSGDLHAQARQHLMDAVRKLDAANKKAESEKVQALLAEQKFRDLTIELSFQGVNVDLDLRVKEPIGTLCSAVNPMTTNGGALKEQVFDRAEGVYTETYSAAQAFPGTYKVFVDRVAGWPQGDKAQIKVTKHKGTADERIEYFTVNLKEQTEVNVTLDSGRRTDLAVLPSPVDMAKYKAKADKSDQVMNKLRALVSGNGSMSGGVGAPGKSSLSDAATGVNAPRVGDVTWSTRLGAERSVGLDIRSETTIRPDGKVEVKATPVFEANLKDSRVKLDLIPGGGN
ncbi:MAG TPA: VWA domain-containing protein [Gemmataceae bacterium]|jgi:tetratricopeptide (TPR) repeat protein|nr:VWA domain-containing protein [Gemmataceae bacterium]